MTGAWTARWGAWLVSLQQHASGWDVRVWRWPDKAPHTEREELAAQTGFASQVLATAWACDVMRKDGTKVMVVDAPSITLERMLKFIPAPQAVA